MKKLFLYSLILLASFAFTFGIIGNAQALLCESGYVEGSVDCADGIVGVSNVSAGVLNSYNYFGENDWVLLSKQDVGTSPALYEPIDIDLEVNPTTGTNSGTYSFNTDTWDFCDDIMVVLKDGGVGVEKIQWFAYKLGEGNFEGDWAYPSVVGGPLKELSYLAVYGRGGDVPVPEPATIFLLGSGLIGLAGFGRKKFKK